MGLREEDWRVILPPERLTKNAKGSRDIYSMVVKALKNDEDDKKMENYGTEGGGLESDPPP